MVKSLKSGLCGKELKGEHLKQLFECFWGYTGISLSVHLSVHVQNTGNFVSGTSIVLLPLY